MKKEKNLFFLLAILIISFFLRLPSLFEPNWYGDEGIYQVIGKSLRAGSLLYRDIWDNKPPLLYLLYALVNGEHFWVRFLSLLFLLFSSLAFYFLAKKLFKKTLPVFLSTLAFAILFSGPLLEGNIANAENFMLFPVILSALLVLNYTLNAKRSTLVLAGFLLSLAFLIKIVAIFDLAAFILFLALLESWQKKKVFAQVEKFGIKIFPLFLAFSVPVILTVSFFAFKGVLGDFLTATFSQNVGYVGVGGLLVLKLLFLAVFVMVIFWQRQRLDRLQIFLILWLSFSLFNAFFAQRPWTHYLLVLLPSFSLLLGAIFEDKTWRFLNLFLILFVLSLIPRNFWVYGKTPFYYQNFLSFIQGEKSVSSYQSFFAPHVERDYALAQFLKGKLKKEEGVFIWGDNPQIYTLADRLPPGRFSVAYHITFYPNAIVETKEALKLKKPKYIVLIKTIHPYEEFLKGYKLAFIVGNSQVYERNNFLP